MQRRDNQGGRLLMRIPARPRLPDGDCVFISDARIVACADFADADCAWHSGARRQPPNRPALTQAEKIGRNRSRDPVPQTRGFLTDSYYAAKWLSINPAHEALLRAACERGKPDGACQMSFLRVSFRMPFLKSDHLPKNFSSVAVAVCSAYLIAVSSMVQM